MQHQLHRFLLPLFSGMRTTAGRGRGSSDDELNSDCSSFGSIEDLESDFRREELFEGKFKRFPANPVNWRPSSNNPGILIGASRGVLNSSLFGYYYHDLSLELVFLIVEII